MNLQDNNAPKLRQTRSFVRRQGRMTDAQRRAIDTLWSRFVVEPPLIADLLGQSTDDWILEIGFGMGESLLRMAINEPDKHFLGIEVHRPGIGAILASIETHQVNNIRIASADALEILERQISDERLSRIQIYFPDPWPKKRHHKRRLINTENGAMMLKKLQPGGELHIATDWPEYAEHIEAQLSALSGFTLMKDRTRPAHRPVTKFEQRGQRLGHPIVDLRFVKTA